MLTKSDRCRHCYRRHRSWQARAQCLLRPTFWVTGNPPLSGPCFASISDCGRWAGRVARTVILYPTREEAEKAKRRLDNDACGGRCSNRHRVIELRP